MFNPSLRHDCYHICTQWLLNMNLQNIIIEVDCQAVADGLSFQTKDITEFHCIIRNVIFFFNSISNSKVSVVRKQVNKMPIFLLGHLDFMLTTRSLIIYPIVFSHLF